MRQIEVSREFLDEFKVLKNWRSTVYFTLNNVDMNEKDFPCIHNKLFKSDNVIYLNGQHNDFAEVWAGKAEYVAKEQLYYVKLIDNNDGYLNLNVETNMLFTFKIFGNSLYKTQFTEQEIKAIDERYWAFAEKAEEE